MIRLAFSLIVLLLPSLAFAQGSFGLGVGPGYSPTGYSNAFPGAAQVPQQAYPSSATGSYGSGGVGANLQISRGNTIFGGLSLLHDPIEQVDLHLLYQQAVTLATNSATYADQANQRANGLIQQHAAYAAQLAEIRARSQAVATAMQAVGDVGIKAFSAANTGNGGGAAFGSSPIHPAPAPAPAPTSILLKGSLAQQVANNKCVRCHSPQGEASYFDLTDVARLEPLQIRSVMERITTGDPAKKMPKDGQALDPGEIMAFLQSTQN